MAADFYLDCEGEEVEKVDDNIYITVNQESTNYYLSLTKEDVEQLVNLFGLFVEE